MGKDVTNDKVADQPVDLPTQFLDYTIKISSDGVVLVDKSGCNAMPGGCHFGKSATRKSVDEAKKAAVYLFMIARPEKFDGSIYWRLTGQGGSYHEWFGLKRALQDENIEMPMELVQAVDGPNFLIGFNNQAL